MISLVAACILFFLIHSLVSGTGMRAVIVGWIGEKAYRGIFSLISLGTIVWMARSYNAVSADGSNYLWNLGYPAYALALVLVFAGFMLVVVGITTPNPTSVRQEGLLKQDDPARGILRVTRHPFLVGVSLWAFAHLLANGDLGSVIFFATFLAVALLGMANIDVKRAKADPQGWARFAEKTSRMPFLAIVQRRNVFRPGEIGWARTLGGLAVYGLVLYFHGWIFGRPLVGF